MTKLLETQLGFLVANFNVFITKYIKPILDIYALI